MSLRRFTIAAAILLGLLGPGRASRRKPNTPSEDKSDDKSGEDEKPAEEKPAAPRGRT